MNQMANDEQHDLRAELRAGAVVAVSTEVVAHRVVDLSDRVEADALSLAAYRLELHAAVLQLALEQLLVHDPDHHEVEQQDHDRVLQHQEGRKQDVDHLLQRLYPLHRT